MEFMPFIVAIFGILMPLGILAIIFGYTNQNEKRYHETVQKIIDSGQELNEEILSGIPGYKKVHPRDDVKNGINTIGVGIGLILLGFIALGSVITGVGFLVSCIGIAVYLNGRMNRSGLNKSVDDTVN